MLIFDVTRETLEEGLDVDFMTGEYAYKNRLATALVPLYRVRAGAGQMRSWKSEAVEKIIRGPDWRVRAGFRTPVASHLFGWV